MSRVSVVLLIGTTILVLPGPTAARQTATEEDILERILELREELERLLQSLSPEQRQEVERRWRARQESAPIEPPIEPPVELPVEPVSEPMIQPPPIRATDEAEVPQDLVVTDERTELDSVPLAAPAAAAGSSCGTLTAFDSNEDGMLSASDRYWRYFRLSLEKGRSLEPTAIETLYDQGIREIRLELDFFKMSDGTTGDISVNDRIHLQLVGKRRQPVLSGVLTIEAGRLARGGEVHLADDQGATLAGVQVIRPGVALVAADGNRQAILCP